MAYDKAYITNALQQKRKETKRALENYEYERSRLDSEVFTAIVHYHFTWFEVAAILDTTEDEVKVMYERHRQMIRRAEEARRWAEAKA
jgi:DNA-directed RNA polymerase specialized sigma24 family protein